MKVDHYLDQGWMKVYSLRTKVKYYCGELVNMDVMIIFLILDMIGTFGTSMYFIKQLERDIRSILRIGAFVPIILFALATIPNLSEPNFINLFTQQLIFVCMLSLQIQ